VAFHYTVIDDQGAAADTPATATITVEPVNDAPVATAVSASGDEDTTIPVTLTGSDVDGSVVSVTLTSLPENGTLYTDAELTTVAHTGTAYDGGPVTFSFAPAENFNGTVTFGYTVTDDQGAPSAAPATATITVDPVNDAPVADAVDVSGNEDTAI